MEDIQRALFDMDDPEFNRMKDYARREAVERRTFVNRDPVDGMPIVITRDEKSSPKAAASPSSSADRRKQAYRILTDETPRINSRRGLLERLVNAAVYAGMRVDFNQGEVRGVKFVDTSLKSMDYRVVIGSYGFQLPKDFEEARKAYDDVIRRLR